MLGADGGLWQSLHAARALCEGMQRVTAAASECSRRPAISLEGRMATVCAGGRVDRGAERPRAGRRLVDREGNTPREGGVNDYCSRGTYRVYGIATPWGAPGGDECVHASCRVSELLWETDLMFSRGASCPPVRGRCVSAVRFHFTFMVDFPVAPLTSYVWLSVGMSLSTPAERVRA